ncbi:MAG: YmdB family metallophosphoesterase [Treponema sp.]|jgi:metallophosphoesterase (TIGR00282 family)|nr:YmdB family metallophosphoesterase [Treponema sp.]
MKLVRAAMIGDIVGRPGLEVLEAKLPALIKDHKIDFVTVNGENAADGFGMTEKDYKQIIAAGADVVTSGNHVWEKREFWPVLESKEPMLRPANYPSGAPGTGYIHIQKNNINWIVINLQGRELMSAIDCPFRCFDHLVNIHEGRVTDIHPLLTAAGSPHPSASPVILVDFHAESSREKESLAYHLDGRATVIAGTHTHVQTADERILPKGSAYITDLGMTGVSDSIIGFDAKICLDRVRSQVMYRMETAAGNNTGRMQGIIAEIDADTGTAVSIKRI